MKSWACLFPLTRTGTIFWLTPRFVRRGWVITWQDYSTAKLIVSDFSFRRVQLHERGQYTFQTVDGSILQIYYAYDRSTELLRAARLAFYKVDQRSWEIAGPQDEGDSSFDGRRVEYCTGSPTRGNLLVANRLLAQERSWYPTQFLPFAYKFVSGRADRCSRCTYTKAIFGICDAFVLPGSIWEASAGRKWKLQRTTQTHRCKLGHDSFSR